METSANKALADAEEAATLAAIGATVPVVSNRKDILKAMQDKDKLQAKIMLQAMLSRRPI